MFNAERGEAHPQDLDSLTPNINRNYWIDNYSDCAPRLDSFLEEQVSKRLVESLFYYCGGAFRSELFSGLQYSIEIVVWHLDRNLGLAVRYPELQLGRLDCW